MTGAVFCNITIFLSPNTDVNYGAGILVENAFGFLVKLFPQSLNVIIVTVRCILEYFCGGSIEDPDKVNLEAIPLLVAVFMNLSVTVIEPASAPAEGNLVTSPTTRFMSITFSRS